MEVDNPVFDNDVIKVHVKFLIVLDVLDILNISASDV
jgi:hypothetical protein